MRERGERRDPPAGPRIRISDVELDWRDLIERMHEGFVVCEVVRVDGAAVDYRHLHVNAVFGTLTGLELAAIVRREHPDVAVVLATGYSDVRDIEPGLVDVRLAKPFDRRRLEEALCFVRAGANRGTGA